jgi:hypothetical protein
VAGWITGDEAVAEFLDHNMRNIRWASEQIAKDLCADTDSTAFKIGDGGGQVLGTLGAPGAEVLLLRTVVNGTKGLLIVRRAEKSEAAWVNKIWCFPPGTQVLMADGSSKAIEDVQEGEYVLANDPESGKQSAARKVSATLTGQTMRLIDIAFDKNDDGQSDGDFKATGLHPIWTKNGGWKDAESIRAGDVLESSDGSPLEVLSATVIHGYSKTHNLTVDGVHTFYVVASGVPVLVHNDPPRIHGIAPDWVTKGVHVTSNGVELGIRGGGSNVKIVPIFSGNSAAAVRAATANVETWLANEAWRNSLLERTRAATSHLGSGAGFAAGTDANAAARAASGGTRALEVSLERWCR